MTRIAIIGGGLSGLTAAYELEKARQAGQALDWHLYEESDRLGGVVETTCLSTPEGEFVCEGGPDGWVTEKPWARELAIELGLGDELIFSNDAQRRTYIHLDARLQAIPDGMRLMVPESLPALEGSSLFSLAARQAYASEVTRAEELKAGSPLLAPGHDESVASFVRRHFGHEVLNKLAAPLLSGVFGGDVERLSVRAVMPQFVRMERDDGSLVLALQRAKAERGSRGPQPIFTSLRRGMGSLVEALAHGLPAGRVHRKAPVSQLAWGCHGDKPGSGLSTPTRGWSFSVGQGPFGIHHRSADHVILATPLDGTRALLQGVDPKALAQLLATDASSAFLVTLVWSPQQASEFAVPSGFGFLAPQQSSDARDRSEMHQPSIVGEGSARSGQAESGSLETWPAQRGSSTPGALPERPRLLACTFVDQKFPFRAPSRARVLRAFFGSAAAHRLAAASDEAVSLEAIEQIASILGPVPKPEHTLVRRWPRSLPQYELGHLDRVAELERRIAALPGLHLLGNALHGVGLPDLVREARETVRRLMEKP